MGKEPKTGAEMISSVHDYEWEDEKLDGKIPGKKKMLSRDPETGAYTRIFYLPPGSKDSSARKHEFWEEIFVLEGHMVDYATNKVYPKGSYALRQAGVIHGPFGSELGCTLLETTWYDRNWYEKNKQISKL